MKVVHYTKPFFKLRPITIKNGDGKTGPFIKPHGGLWCSPLDSEYGWIDWCRAESFGDIDHEQRVVFDVDTRNFVVIDSLRDMEIKLPWFQIHELFSAIDFQKMISEGIDGVHLTIKGEAETRFSYPRTLYGWDCETILILNERCIKEVSL